MKRGFLSRWIPRYGRARASIIIAGHNEGDRLWKTVRSTLATTEDLDREVLVVDDASTDGSVAEVHRRYPGVRVITHRRRRGGPAAKDVGGRRARGNVLVFLDGHCKPERFAIEMLINNVEDLGEEAIFTPRVPSLDCERWENSTTQVGHGYRIVKLVGLEGAWMGLDELRPRGRFFECPALIGCCMAVSRNLYRKLWGFDRHMIEWGAEDFDLGLKAWLMGYPVLHNPNSTIGHRFRSSFDNFTVTFEGNLSNQMRMARKNLTEGVWEDWLERVRETNPEGVWKAAWTNFSRSRRSVERERRYLMARRIRDEFWYARRFGLDWPR